MTEYTKSSTVFLASAILAFLPSNTSAIFHAGLWVQLYVSAVGESDGEDGVLYLRKRSAMTSCA